MPKQADPLPAVIRGLDPGIQVKRKAFNTKVTKGTKDTKRIICFAVILGLDPRIQVRKAVTMKGPKWRNGCSGRKPSFMKGR